MHSLSASAKTVHIGHFDAKLKPVLSVNDGELIKIRSVSGSTDDPVPEHWLPPEISEIRLGVSDQGPGPHILTGPIFVRGAKPGAVLQVDIVDIRLGAEYGYNTMVPLKGMFPDRPTTRMTSIIPLDRERGLALLPSGIVVPTQPFFGILGVAPSGMLGRVSSSPPGPHGGNLDNKELRPGSSLFLPIFVAGALFSAGDGHAAQGDGEVNVSAIETCLEGVFRLRTRDDFQITSPIAVTGEHLITMGFHENLDEAARLATGFMIDILCEHWRMSWNDAYTLCSVAADLRVTQFVNQKRGVHALLGLSLLKPLPDLPPFLVQPGRQ